MGKHMKKVSWLGVALLVVIVGIWGCNLFDKDEVSPTGPGNAVTAINAYVNGTAGALYSAYNQSTQFCVSLAKGCWVIKYVTSDGGLHYAVANVDYDPKGLAVVGVLPGAGMATTVSVAKRVGSCPPPATNVVQYYGTEPANDGQWVQVVGNGVPVTTGKECPVGAGGSPAASLRTFNPVTVAFLE